MAKQAEQKEPQVDFLIQKVFTEDLSFESPNAPIIFKENWHPEANIELNTESSKIDDDTHEVKLRITVTAKSKENTAFLAEVLQVGIFTIRNISDEAQIGHILGSFCPATLFPYARETVSTLVSRGGFPELSLAPINFDALYAQGLEAAANKDQSETKQTKAK